MKELKYNAILKTQIVKENTRVSKDKFSTWNIANKGGSTLLINGLIPLEPGEYFECKLEPYVQYAEDINISFSGNIASSLAIVNLFYFQQI